MEMTPNIHDETGTEITLSCESVEDRQKLQMELGCFWANSAIDMVDCIFCGEYGPGTESVGDYGDVCFACIKADLGPIHKIQEIAMQYFRMGQRARLTGKAATDALSPG